MNDIDKKATSQESEKPKKLTLSAGKLTLGNVGSGGMKGQTFINAKTNTVTVEVKRGVANSSLVRKADNSILSSDSGDSDVMKKLNLLKRASGDTKHTHHALQKRSEEVVDAARIFNVADDGYVETNATNTHQVSADAADVMVNADLSDVQVGLVNERNINEPEKSVASNYGSSGVMTTTVDSDDKKPMNRTTGIVEKSKEFSAKSGEASKDPNKTNRNNTQHPKKDGVQDGYKRDAGKPNVAGASDAKHIKSDVKPDFKKEVKKIVKRPEDEDDFIAKRNIADKPQVGKSDAGKIRKVDIFHMLNHDEEDDSNGRRKRSMASIRRAREKAKRQHSVNVTVDKVYRDITIPSLITVSEFANRISERVADVVRELMKLGVIATANQSIDGITAELVGTTLGHSVKIVDDSDVENVLSVDADDPAALVRRSAVVTIMGHVDHGKTSLLDALKSTDVAAQEAGGITQHIGAYRVLLNSGQSITFLDTPGHEAFTEMRSRGANITDIVVLVVAADDGIMPQTVEAINHAKAANVPIIVAINKIDKHSANIEKVKNELLIHGLVTEDLGGDVMYVPVSALKKMNLDKLEETILLMAEMSDLKANPNASASGTVIEARIDTSKGVIATVLVQRGTLKVGDIVVASESYGRVKKMINDHGKVVKDCTPSVPVEIWGFDKPPMAGDIFSVVPTEKHARDICDYRARKAAEARNVAVKRSSLEELFLKASGKSGIKELPIIIKGDVRGSIEAIANSIMKLSNEEVVIRILHSAAGGITESDVALATASKAVILGFNVRANVNAAMHADKNAVDIRYYSIIYNLIEDVSALVSGMLSPIIREEYLGSAEIRQVFNITKVGKVAGCYVKRGVIKRGVGVRLVRSDVVIYEGSLKRLKRFSDDVKEVKENFECGISLENYEDIQVGDMVEVFEVIEQKRS